MSYTKPTRLETLFFPNTFHLPSPQRPEMCKILAHEFASTVCEFLKTWVPECASGSFSVLTILEKTHPGGFFRYTAKELNAVDLGLPTGCPERPLYLAKNLNAHPPKTLTRISRIRGMTVYHFKFVGNGTTPSIPVIEDAPTFFTAILELAASLPEKVTEKEYSSTELATLLNKVLPYSTPSKIGRELTSLRAFYPRLVPRKRMLKGIAHYTLRKPPIASL